MPRPYRKREQTVTRTMFSMPTLAGQLQLRELVDAYGGAERVCRDFRVASRVLGAYLSGEREPPLTFMLAVYWQGPFGFNHAFCESHWTHQANSGRVRDAEMKAARIAALLGEVRHFLESSVGVIGELAQSNGLADVWSRPQLLESLDPFVVTGVSGS